MIGSGFSIRHVWLIAGFSLRHSLRTGAGIIYLVIALGFCLYSADGLLKAADSSVVTQLSGGEGGDEGEKIDRMMSMASEIVKPVIREYAIGDAQASRDADKRAEEWTAYLLQEQPAFLSALFIFLLIGMPFIIPFGAFNQTSGDIGTKGLRYLLLRSERINVFLGRYLGTAIFLVIVQALSIAIVVTFVAIRLDNYGTGDLISWGLHGMAALMLLTLAYVALAAMLSACVDTPMASLVLLKVTVGGVWLGAILARQVHDYFDYIKWLLPWGIQNQLIAPEPGRVAAAGLACVGYAMVFLFLGFKRFETRDL